MNWKSFGWLAIIMIWLLFFISLLSDIEKLITPFKNTDVKNVMKIITNKTGKNRQVAEKDGNLFNHPNFQQIRNSKIWIF